MPRSWVPACPWHEGGVAGHLLNPKETGILLSWEAAGPGKARSCADRALAGAGTSRSHGCVAGEGAGAQHGAGCWRGVLARGATLLTLPSSTEGW